MISKIRQKDLDKSGRVDFVDDVARLTTGLAVQIIALYEDTVITETAHPHVSLTLQY